MSPQPPVRTHSDSPWFALADILLVLTAGALWYNWPALGPWPLGLALLPWGVRLVGRRFPFKRTPLDPLFLLFFLTAVLGVWAAYDVSRALAKFWLVLDGILLYYALAGQPRENLWRVAWGLGAAAAALPVYFFLTHNWQVEPAKLALLNRIGLAWMAVRPTLPTHVLHPNVVAGITALTLPFLAAAGWRARSKNRILAAAAGVGLSLSLFTLLMSTSRGAWLALGAAAGVWLLWELAGRWSERAGRSREWAFAGLLGVLMALALVLVLLSPGGLWGALNSLPGPARVGSRLDLMRALVFLVGDFPFTGGGLDAFPGLYSRYILVIPSFQLDHGHSFFLDITLEQGLAGGFAALGVFGFSLIWMARRISGAAVARDDTPLLIAALVSLLAMGFHGLLDDVLYGSRGSLLLWIAPGLGMAAIDDFSQAAGRLTRVFRPVFWASSGPLVLLAAVLLFPQARAAWTANLGAVQMSRIELARFPSDSWDLRDLRAPLQPVSGLLTQALEADPQNRTAHHRLGLIALHYRDFDLAAAHLQIAHEQSPGHRGVAKALAYALLWADRPEAALPLLAQIPEARFELENYIWWWRRLGRLDLSRFADTAIQSLSGP